MFPLIAKKLFGRRRNQIEINIFPGSGDPEIIKNWPA
jgi:hypothetical protein